MFYTKADLKKEASKSLWLGIAVGGAMAAAAVVGVLAAKKFIPFFREYRELKAWKDEQERVDLMNRFGTAAPHSTFFDRIKNGISHSLSDEDMFDDYDDELEYDPDDAEELEPEV